MNKTKIALLLLAPFLLAACTHNKAETTTQPTINSLPVDGSTSNDDMMMEEDSMMEQKTQASVKEIDLVAKQWEWQPDTITVNQGDTVKLNITSLDVDHGLAIPQYNINESFSPGETITVEFVADKTGEFRFSCSVICGQGHGQMTGTLIVQ